MTARRFKPYSAYKDSGVEWLEKIPTNWEAKRLKHFALLNPEALPEDTDPSLEMVYVDIGGVDGLGRINERQRLTFASAPSRARRLVRDGDVIVSTVRTYLRAIAPISDPDLGMVVSTGFAVVRPTGDLTTNYAAYALRAPYFVERVVANSKGVSFPAINESEMATYEIAVPPDAEQRAIAAFLDRETEMVDALVAKKERLIELLQEQRTAIITRAVTKGLNPNVRMKDSGVEWLGEIPAHWESRPLRTTCEITGRIGYRGYTVADLVPEGQGAITLSPGNIRDDTLDLTECTYISWHKYQESPEIQIEPSDIILTKTGSTLGKVALIAKPAESMTINPQLVILRRRKGVSAAFMAYVLRCNGLKDLYWLDNTGGATPTISQQKIGRLSIPVPPSLEEQQGIATFLDRQTTHIDALVAKVRDAIDRLKELRTALIAAAVTGKIDVREDDT